MRTSGPNLPAIHGVPLVGGVILTPAEFLARERPRLTFQRPTGPYTSCSAPAATSAYACAIVVALLRRWSERPDRDALVSAAARHFAADRLHDLYHHRITPARAQIEQLQRELTEHQRLAAELCHLAGEYHDRYANQDADGAEQRSA